MGTKKDEIDFAIARRINKLFKILEHRFSGDLKIWSSHIAFLIKVGWKEQVGKVYRRCLQVHPDKVDLRICSARYELEQAMSDDTKAVPSPSPSNDCGLRVENARTILMEAIRFHPDCRDLYVEAFSLELVFVDWLLADSDGKNRHMVSEETAEAVKDGKIAEAIFNNGWKNACPSTEDKTEYGLKCLKLAAVDFQAPIAIVQAISKKLEDNLGTDNAQIWESLALLHLNESKWAVRSQLDKLTECSRTYEKGLLEHMTQPTTRQCLLTSYIKALKDISARFNLDKKSQQFLSHRLWLALQFGKKQLILNLELEELYDQLCKEEA